MKLKWTEETTTKVISNSIILIIAIFFYFLFNNIHGFLNIIKKVLNIFSPFIIGFVIAYLLSRPVNLLENFFNRYLFKKLKKRRTINRLIANISVIIFAFLILFLIISLIIPQLIESISMLAVNADSYIQSINASINKAISHFDLTPNVLLELFGTSQEIFKKVTQHIASNLPSLLNFSLSIGSGITDFFIGLIVSIYMLGNKELFAAQFKKILFALFPEKIVGEILSACEYMHDTFGKYIAGQILDSALLGTICFILMNIFKMEYPLLISTIITITNFIPFIGPFIGAIPSAFILLMVEPMQALWFLVMILVLQQIDGNILVPRIVGKTTGLSSFWVIFSILVGGGFFGVAGFFLSVPTFSLAYMFFKRYINRKLRKKGLSQKTTSYYPET